MRCAGVLCLAIIVQWSTLMYTIASDCECGRAQTHFNAPRIINGAETRPHEYPWMAIVLYLSYVGVFKENCGGSVINDGYVMTAAHCVQQGIFRLRPQEVKVVLGAHNSITMDNGNARTYEVSQIIVHPQHSVLYDGNVEYIQNDIALLKLKERIKFDRFVSPICLPYEGEDFTHRIAIVSGWGNTVDLLWPTTIKDRFLHYALLWVLSNKECMRSNMAPSFMPISEQVMCAAGYNVDACKGDSGGPLIVKTDDNIIIQIGIVSFGFNCNVPNYPGIYVKVSYFVDWILQMTRDAMYCRKPDLF